ncbi:MAG: hypothetical protein U0Q15_05690 [Kineosporiaceae bacterium]
MPQAGALALVSGVLLVALALLAVEVRTRWGGCCAHRRWAWMHAARAADRPAVAPYTGRG